MEDLLKRRPRLVERPPPADEYLVVEMFKDGESVGYFIGCEPAGFGGVEGNACAGSLIEAVKCTRPSDAVHNQGVVDADSRYSGVTGKVTTKTRADYDAALVHES